MIQVLLIFCAFWILYAGLYRLIRHFWKPKPVEIPFFARQPARPERESKFFRYTEDGRQFVAYENSETYNLILKALNKK